MKKTILTYLILIFCLQSFSQNVGIGTNTPIEKLDVNGNLNIGGTIRLGGVGGQDSEVISATGSGIQWGRPVYVIKSTNISSITVPQNNYVRIDGVISLTSNYTGFNGQKLTISGGTLIGNGATVVNIGLFSTVIGTTFTNIDIDANAATFINCSFSGNVPRIGSNCKYINCQFSGLTLGSSVQLGGVYYSSIQNATIPRATEFANTEIINCFIGNGGVNLNGISEVANCTILNSYFYAFQNENFLFSGNTCRSTKIVVGNSSQSPNYITISNNLFNGVLSGESEVIQINPSSNYFKLYTISNNNFSLQSSTPRAIDVSLNDGNPFANSRMSIQNNTFWNSMTTLNYLSNMRISYIYNTVFQTGSHPVNTGNLVTNNSITLF